MENQFQFIAKFTNSLPKLFHGQNRQLDAAIFDQNSEISLSPPHCAICLNDVCGGDRYRKLPVCGHFFHAQCIDPWFQTRSSCPLCRVEVPQLISLNENQYQCSAHLSRVLSLLQDFADKVFNPLNDELTTKLTGNIRCNFS